MPRFLQQTVWVASLAIASWAIAHQSAFAKPSSINLITIEPQDPYCYMQTGDNRTINLNKLCGRSPVLSSLDQIFLARYQALVRNRISNRAQAPEVVVGRAKQMCASIRAGVPANLPIDNSRVLDADIIKELALQNYCPDLDD